MTFRKPALSFSTSWRAFWLGHGTSLPWQVAAVMACLATMALLAWQFVNWRVQYDALRLQAEQLQAEQERQSQRSARPRAAPVALKPGEASRHNLAVGQLNAPWSDIFDGLERSANPDIGLTLLEPDAKRGTLRIQAEAKDLDVLIVYAEHLARDPSFADLVLQQHETNDQDPNRPARLSFMVRLAPPVSAGGAR
jgi:Tfp pilus assembly protein FimT